MAAQMAADGGLRRLFEKPLPENPTLLEALSAWNHRSSIHPKNPVDPASFTEIFGELHFQEKPDHHRAVLPPSPAAAARLPPPPRATTTTSSWADAADQADKSKDDSSLDALLRPPKPASTVMKRSASFCMKSLLLCTEGLGSESTVDADDMFKDGDAEAEAAALGGGKDAPEADGGAEVVEEEAAAAAKEEKRPPPTFPPPIRSIGRVGKPSVCFRSFRTDGRFVLMEVVIPGKELLQAYREGGRLRLQFADGAAATGVFVNKEMRGQDHGEGKELCTMNEAQC